MLRPNNDQLSRFPGVMLYLLMHCVAPNVWEKCQIQKFAKVTKCKNCIWFNTEAGMQYIKLVTGLISAQQWQTKVLEAFATEQGSNDYCITQMMQQGSLSQGKSQHMRDDKLVLEWALEHLALVNIIMNMLFKSDKKHKRAKHQYRRKICLWNVNFYFS